MGRLTPPILRGRTCQFITGREVFTSARDRAEITNYQVSSCRAECGMSGMRRAVGLEHLTLLDVAPPEFVTLAAGAGFDAVGLRIAPVALGEEPWPMSLGSPMLAETRRRCADAGVAVHAVEAIVIRPGGGLSGCERVIETAAALGARYLNVICDDPDTERFADLFAALVPQAWDAGVRPVIEFTAWRPVRRLADAVSIAQRSGGGRILLDSLHIQRCGVTLAELSQVPPALLSYLQLCDAPLRQPHGLLVPAGAAPGGQQEPGDTAVAEARAMRLLPGEGELPLTGLLDLLPAGMIVSVEAPSAAARSAASPAEYAARARRAVRRLAG
jgi:sugar phosphate isomerase/epimerase